MNKTTKTKKAATKKTISTKEELRLKHELEEERKTTGLLRAKIVELLGENKTETRTYIQRRNVDGTWGPIESDREF